MSATMLTGKNIYLRRLTPADVSQRYVEWLNDPAVNRFLETKHSPQTLLTITDFVRMKSSQADEHLFGIFLLDHRHIGNIKLGPVNPHHRNGDLSLFLGEKSAWGKGFASEAIGLITAWAFREQNMLKLKAGCYSANEGSARAFEKNGFRREGLFRDHLLFEGQPMDMIVLGLTRKEFYEAHA